MNIAQKRNLRKKVALFKYMELLRFDKIIIMLNRLTVFVITFVFGQRETPASCF